MGRDEDLPEVVPKKPTPVPEAAHNVEPTSLPEVKPDYGPQAISDYYVGDPQLVYPRYLYPANYDNADKLLFEPPTPTAAVWRQDQGGQPLSPGPTSALSPNETVPWDPSSPIGKEELYVGPQQPEDSKRRVCGLSQKVFIMVVIAILVVVGAAVGGAVAGVLKANNDNEPLTETTPTATTTTDSGQSASSLATGTPLVGFKFQAWEEPEYKGNTSRLYIEEGFYDFGFMAWSYIWVPKNTKCCLTFCVSPTNHTPTGWWCEHRRRPKTDEAFGRLNIWCGGDTNSWNQRRCNETQEGGKWEE